MLHLLAVAQLDPVIQALLFGLAVVLFVLDAWGYEHRRVSFLAAGLAAFAFVFFWNALAAA